MTKRRGTAWAVVDINRRDALDVWDLCENKQRALKLAGARRGISYPIHQDSVWKVVRVRIEEL